MGDMVGPDWVYLAFGSSIIFLLPAMWLFEKFTEWIES